MIQTASYSNVSLGEEGVSKTVDPIEMFSHRKKKKNPVGCESEGQTDKKKKKLNTNKSLEKKAWEEREQQLPASRVTVEYHCSTFRMQKKKKVILEWTWLQSLEKIWWSEDYYMHEFK